MELGRDVSQEEQHTENIHGMRKIYKLLYVIDTLSLPNPIMAVFYLQVVPELSVQLFNLSN